ncbi:MAG TPA: hypothetical protein VF310_04555 [Vicinamibacteria bacterium]
MQIDLRTMVEHYGLALVLIPAALAVALAAGGYWWWRNRVRS